MDNVSAMGELIFAAIAVAAGLFAAGYRKAAVALAAVVLAAGIGVYFVEERQDKEVESRVTPSEVVVQDVTFVHTFRSSYDLRGRLTNKSQTYAIDRVGFAVTLQDCRGNDNAAACTDIGRTTAYASVRVLPEETRDFTASMYFGSEDIKPKGRLVWHYEIASIAAKRP